MENDNIVRPELTDEQEENLETSLRPKTLKEYIGQTKVKESMKIYIEAAKKRKEPLDHCLFYGPPGLGKTTISGIIANEMHSNIKITSGPAIEKPGDLAGLLTSLEEFDVLFIDEIHRLSKTVEEILYPALEDYVLDITIGKGPEAKSIRLDLPKFTLIGATTKAGALTTPLRDRFGIVQKLELYSVDDLSTIVKRSSKILKTDIDDLSCKEIARRSRGTPRIANRLLKRVRDFALVLSDGKIDLKITKHALNQLEIDLELYREKTQLLSQENKDLKNKINLNNNISPIIKKESNMKRFSLEELSVSTFSITFKEGKVDDNNFTIFNKENLIISNNKETNSLQHINSGNLFAPPCLINNDNNITNDNKLFSNNIEEIKDLNDEKKYVNTPGEDEIRNSLNIKENCINPYLNYENERCSNINENNKKNLFDLNNIRNSDLINSYENLNINNELSENKKNEIKNEEKKSQVFTNFGDSNNLLNNNIENSLSLKDMENILIQKFENKISISSYDYLHLYTNDKIKEIFSKIGENYKHCDIFSDMIYLLDKYEQLYKNIIFITKKCVYIIEPESYKIKYTFVRTILLRFTLSSINCNIIVFHFMTSNDLVFMTLRRPELISYFINTEKNIKNYRKEIKFRYADEFNIKKDGDYYTQKIKSSMNSTSFNFQTAIKLGYLIKINEGYLFSKYHEKLVVLTEFGLFYFDNPTLAPKKLVSIIGAEIKDLKNKFGEKLFSFEIVTMNHYKIIFGTYCKEDYEEWLEKLRETKNKFENKNMFLG